MISYHRTITIGSQTYFKGSNDIRVLKALWHPYSDSHLGILSSDSVFRYNFSFFVLILIYVLFTINLNIDSSIGSYPGLCKTWKDIDIV